MNKEKFPEYREKVFHYIQKEILPNYPEIKSCNMHILPEYMNNDVEYIFKLTKELSDKEKYHLKRNLDKDLANFCDSFDIFYFIGILIIFI